jgi:hypothetical protein
MFAMVNMTFNIEDCLWILSVTQIAFFIFVCSTIKLLIDRCVYDFLFHWSIDLSVNCCLFALKECFFYIEETSLEAFLKVFLEELRRVLHTIEVIASFAPCELC